MTYGKSGGLREGDCEGESFRNAVVAVTVKTCFITFHEVLSVLEGHSLAPRLTEGIADILWLHLKLYCTSNSCRSLLQ